MSEPRRHHYLPISYLRRFTDDGTDDGQLWLFDIDDRVMRQLRPINTGIQKHYNALKNKDGTRDLRIERALCEIEGAAVPILDKIERRETLTKAERDKLAFFVAAQMHRVPTFEAEVGKIVESTTKMSMRMLLGNPARAAAAMERFEKETGEKVGLTPEKMADFVTSDRFKVVATRNASLHMMVAQAPKMAGYFQQMDWGFFYAPTGSAFITSDNPFYLMPPSDIDWKPKLYGIGVLTPGTRKIFPLSPRVCLAMFDRGETTHYGEASPESVRDANIGIAADAFRFVIGREESQIRWLVDFIERGERERDLKWGGIKLTIN